MRRFIAAIVATLIFTGGAVAASVTPAEADPVSSTQTRDICLYIEGSFDQYPGGYWYLYQYRTVHLFGGSIHVTQCAYKDYLNRPVWRCYQLAWNLPPGQHASVEQYPANNQDPGSPCW